MLPVGIEIYKTSADLSPLIRVLEDNPNWYKSKTVGGVGGRTSAGLNLISAAKHVPEVADLVDGVRREFMDSLVAYREKYQFVYIQDAECCDLLKYEPGEEYTVHSDYAPNKKRVVSGLIYLNEDFEGGELEFPLLNFTYKPKAGDLVLFPSNYIYAHAAKPVTSGTRYCVVTFFI